MGARLPHAIQVIRINLRPDARDGGIDPGWTMEPMADRYIDVSLSKRGVHCTAKLLDDRAPITCEAVWNALPLGGDVFHAKYARNEIYTLLPHVRPGGAAPGEPDRHAHPGRPLLLLLLRYAAGVDGVRVRGRVRRPGLRHR